MATINDLVLVHVDSKPGFYARIEDICPDVKKDWWQVKLLVLTFPLQIFTWILNEEQLEGLTFTMGGTPLMLEKLISPLELEQRKIDEDELKKKKPVIPADGPSKVVSLAERRKK